MKILGTVCLIAILAWGSLATAAPRVCLLVEEQHDGARAQAGAGEARLAEALLKEGFQLVERYDAEQARSKLSLERLLRGEVAGLEVSGLHADVLVAARLSVNKEEAPYGITYPVHSARIDLRALAVDTGRVFHADSAQSSSPGDAGQAASKAALAAWPKLLEALKKQGASQSLLELRVAGLKEARAADALARELAKVPGVKSATVRFVSADATAIDLSVEKLDSAKLEAALQAAQLGISRRSAGRIEARLDEEKVARRSVTVAAFVNRTARADLGWLEKLLPEVVETELTNSKYLQPSTGRPAIDPEKPSTKGVSSEIVIVGKVESAGAALRLSAKALRVSDGAPLAAAQLFGSEANVAELGRELVWKLDAPLYQKLLGKSSLEGYVAPLARQQQAGAPQTIAVAAPGARVKIDEVKLSDLFPSRLGYYATNPLGRVALRNLGNAAADDVRVEISLGELSGGAQTLRVPPIAPGARVEVPLTIVLDRARLLEITQRRPARADIAVMAGGARDSFTEPLVVWDRNAIDWKETDSIAAFITPKDPVVIGFAADASKLEPQNLPPSLAAAAAQFASLVSVGIKYLRDPLSPYGERAIDTVQFPRETLSRKLGDCDDLSVLYASLVQAIGRDARLILTPGHILVAVDAELAESQAERIGGAKRALILDGHAWIPVEVTKLDAGFAAAWDAGVAELGRHDRSKISTIEIGRAWQSYPPFPLEQPGSAPPIPVESVKKLLLADAAQLGKTTTREGGNEDALGRAIARARRGDLDGAGKDLSKLDAPAVARPLRAAAANNLGNLETLRGRYDAAVAAYKRALDGAAKPGAVRHNLGVAHWLAGRGAEAKKWLAESGTSESKRLMKELGLATTTNAKSGDTSESSRQGLRGAAGEARVDPAAVLIWIR